jgi:hypothetical protein
MLSFLLITGLRATFNIPFELVRGADLRSRRAVPWNIWRQSEMGFLNRILPLYAVLGVLEFLFFSP